MKLLETLQKREKRYTDSLRFETIVSAIAFPAYCFLTNPFDAVSFWVLLLCIGSAISTKKKLGKIKGQIRGIVYNTAILEERRNVMDELRQKAKSLRIKIRLERAAYIVAILICLASFLLLYHQGFFFFTVAAVLFAMHVSVSKSQLNDILAQIVAIKTFDLEQGTADEPHWHREPLLDPPNTAPQP